MAHSAMSLTLLSVRFFQNKNLNDLKLIGMRFKSEGLQPWTTLRGELAAKTAVTSDRAFSVDRRTHTAAAVRKCRGPLGYYDKGISNSHSTVK
jgi:hypothetical protein